MADISLSLAWIWGLLILILTVSNGSAKSFKTVNASLPSNSGSVITKQTPRPDYEVNVRLDSNYDQASVSDDLELEENFPVDTPKNPSSHPVVSFLRKYFLGILLGCVLLLLFGGCICWCRFQEAKYGEFGHGARQRQIDVQTVRRGQGADPESYKDSYDRLKQSKIITGDSLLIGGGKHAHYVAVQKPEDLVPGGAGAFRSHTITSSSVSTGNKIGLQCKLQCAGGGCAESRGAAKRQAYQEIRESYGPAK